MRPFALCAISIIVLRISKAIFCNTKLLDKGLSVECLDVLIPIGSYLFGGVCSLVVLVFVYAIVLYNLSRLFLNAAPNFGKTFFKYISKRYFCRVDMKNRYRPLHPL